MSEHGRFKHHKYTYTNRFGSPSHNWEFVGPTGALNFRVTLTPGYDASCGLEFHHTVCCKHSPNTAPDHVNCPLTGGRCWHDGTSLYASEHVWPMVKGYLQLGEHEFIFRRLEGEYDSHFKQYEKDDVDA